MFPIFKCLAIILSVAAITACGVSNSEESCDNPHPSQDTACSTSNPVWDKMEWDKARWG